MLRIGRHNVIPAGIMDVRVRAPASAAPAGNGLLNALIAFWPGNEANGNLIDAHTNGLNLTDTNTVTNAAGLVYAGARQYTAANDEYHQIADNTHLSTGDVDFTCAAWVYLDSVGVDRTILSKFYYAVNKREYALTYAHSGTAFSFIVSSLGTSVTSTSVTSGTPNTATWYLVVAWHDSVANTISIQVNNGSVASKSHEGGVLDSDSLFVIGKTFTSWGPFNGRIGPTMFWKSAAGGGGVLSADQRTSLYNSGSGLAYASFTT